MRRMRAEKGDFQKIQMPGLTLHLGSSCRVAVERRKLMPAVAGDSAAGFCVEVMP